VDVRALCHELEVHQIELEMQNEELKQAQAELAASEEKYRDLYEFAPIGYLTLEGSGKILEANLAATSILGKERAYLINNLFQSYLAEGSALRFKAFCRSVMDSDMKQTAEFRLRCVGCNGQANSWILVEGRAIQDDVNQGVRMAVTDISERKRAEEALRASESEMRSLFTAMTDVILVLDADGRYLEIAPTNPSLLYRPAEDLIGKTLHDVFPQPLADKYLGYIRQALDTHQIINIEYDLSIADKITWFAGTLSPMPDGRVLLIARDITDSKRAEEELRKAKDELVPFHEKLTLFSRSLIFLSFAFLFLQIR
jgi:PAS domain S-box-containing protein